MWGRGKDASKTMWLVSCHRMYWREAGIIRNRRQQVLTRHAINAGIWQTTARRSHPLCLTFAGGSPNARSEMLAVTRRGPPDRFYEKLKPYVGMVNRAEEGLVRVLAAP